MNNYLKILLVFFTMMIGRAQGHEPSCIQHCNATLGDMIGQSFLTKAYSNCNGSCVTNEKNYLSLPKHKQPIFTGMKWQCVEYVRRWLIENKGVTFGDVDYAYHIWDLPFAETIEIPHQVPLLRFKNKETKEAPQVGDLLINSVALAITGHVSVVVGIERDSITIAEQNYFNRPWEGKNYARRLLLDKDAQGRYRIFDDSLIGWVRVKS